MIKEQLKQLLLYHVSFYYSEEVVSTIQSPQKRIQVSDRAILFKLLIGLEGYTISAGILNGELDGVEIVQGPLDVEDMIKVGWRPIKKQSSAAWPSSTLKNSIIQYV